MSFLCTNIQLLQVTAAQGDIMKTKHNTNSFLSQQISSLHQDLQIRCCLLLTLTDMFITALSQPVLHFHPSYSTKHFQKQFPLKPPTGFRYFQSCKLKKLIRLSALSIGVDSETTNSLLFFFISTILVVTHLVQQSLSDWRSCCLQPILRAINV